MQVCTANLPGTSLLQANQTPASKLLEVVNLTVEYRIGSQRFIAVDEVSFSVARGEIVGVLGESGCGKTTTALALLGVLPENAKVIHGSALFGNHDLLELSEAELQAIRGTQLSLVFQDSAVLNPVIRVGTQVAEVLRAHSHTKRQAARDRICSLFEAIGLHDVERIYDAYPHQLSGGQRQRIAFAQALICRPHLVIADEPTASVDASTTSQILAFIRNFADTNGTAFVIISHDPDALATIADRIVVMYAGKVIEDGPAQEVFANPSHPYTSALMKCSPRKPVVDPFHGKRQLPYIPGESPDPSEVMAGCAFAPRCTDRMAECTTDKPKLLQESKGRFVRCFKYGVG